MESGSLPIKRYSAAAWLFAIAASLFMVGLRVGAGAGELLALLGAAVAIPTAVVSGYVHVGLRLTGQSDEPEEATGIRPRLYAHAAVLVLWLFSCLLLVPLLSQLPDPRFNLLHAEQAGFALVDLLAIVSLTCVAVTLVLLLSGRALANLHPERRPMVMRILSLVAPLALALGAWAAHAYIPGTIDAFETYGSDLPSPTLMVYATYRYWGILPALACLLCAIVLVSDANAARTRAAYTGLLGLLVTGNLLLALVTLAIYLPAIKMCGGPV